MVTAGSYDAGSAGMAYVLIPVSIVLVESEDVGKEARLLGGVPAPRIRDVLNFARKGRSFIFDS